MKNELLDKGIILPSGVIGKDKIKPAYIKTVLGMGCENPQQG